jgi:hypothetical protein
MKSEYKEGLALGARLGLVFVALVAAGFVAYAIYEASIFSLVRWDDPMVVRWLATGFLVGAAAQIIRMIRK